MLSYRHAFHAGNHADVFKHFVLSLITKSFCRKEKPFVFYDVHAGSGLYALESAWAQTTNEAQTGIFKLFALLNSPTTIPPDLLDFIAFEKNLYDTQKDYGGSFVTVSHFARSYDEMILFELHSSEIIDLKANVNALRYNAAENAQKIHVHYRNGFEGLTALTPPKDPLPKRGFILFDPSYEVESDYLQVENTIFTVTHKWNTAVIAVWYPLLVHRKAQLDRLKNRCREKSLEHFYIELCVGKPHALQNRLYGSGMLIINPPYQLHETILKTLPILEECLTLT